MLSSLSDHDLARSFLLLPNRHDAPLAKPYDAVVSLQWNEHFYEHLLQTDNRYHDDDVKLAVDQFFENHPAWWQWWQAAVPDIENFFDFYDGEPRVRESRLSLWREISAELDADGLVCLALALRGQADEAGKLQRWGAFLRGGSHDLDRDLQKGMADPHIHLSACNSVALLWLRLMGQDDLPLRLEDFKRYSRRALSGTTNIGKHEIAHREREKQLIAEARKIRKKELHPLIESAGSPSSKRADEAPMWRLLRDERIMLAKAWAEALANPDKPEFMAQLDRYLVAKSIFIQRHQQIDHTNPGLPRFRHYLDAGEPKNFGSDRYAPKIRKKYFASQIAMASECHYLRRLELRIAPKKQIRDYESFFHIIERIESKKHWRDMRGDVKLDFTVHFIRQPNRGALPNLYPYHSQRRELDRQSAMLHLFRVNRRARSSRITHIDVANMERGAPPYGFIPAFKLLRGEEFSRDRLAAAGFHLWARLHDIDRHRHPTHLPRLGFTYHAGEDYSHPIDGMRHISDLLSHGRFCAGDRIGHGLAPGIDIPRFQADGCRGAVMETGVLMDNVAWMLQRLQYLDSIRDGHLVKLQSLLEKLSSRIYRPNIPVATLFGLQEARYYLGAPEQLAMDRDCPYANSAELWREELENPDIDIRRRRHAPADDIEAFQAFAPEMELLQRDLLERLKKQGVVVEFNPSSNVATGGVHALETHPVFRYIDIQGDRLTATLGTDDPGVFATRLENEYELMFEAMLRKGYERQNAIDILSRLRTVGVELASQ